MRLFSLFVIGAASVLQAAALVPLPSPKQPVSISEIQPNRGQAAPGILFQTRGTISIAAQGAALLFSPLGVRQNFLGGNPDPQVSFFDPLPGVAHDYSTANPQRWITNIPRYAGARLAGMYPGVDVEYTLDGEGKVTLRLVLAPNADLTQVVFELPEAVGLRLDANARTLTAPFVLSRMGPILAYGPVASSASVQFEQLSATTFRLTAPLRNPASPLRIDVPMGGGSGTFADFNSDAQSNLWAAIAVSDAAGKPDPFPFTLGTGCGVSLIFPTACHDVAVYKLSPAGAVVSVTYVSGGAGESPEFLAIAPDGSIVVTGNTNSSDFPVSAGVYQSAYAGPAAIASGTSGPVESGDYFALRLEPASGTLRASTYFGGPNLDRIGDTFIAADGSLYFLHKWLNGDSPGLPTNAGALMRDCADRGSGSPWCLNGYVAHLSSDLSRLIFGTYVPGVTQATMRLHTDGSVYYSGRDSASFQATPGAYQTQINGPGDAIVARLDPTGSRLLFATYLGGSRNDSILRSAVAPDGSVWVSLSSFGECCVDGERRLIRLDSKGENKLVDLRMDASDVGTDREGNVLVLTDTPFTPSPGAVVSNPCPAYGIGYVKLSAAGEPLFFTYLPRTSNYDFHGTGPHGLPILRLNTVIENSTRFEIVEDRDMGLFAGCLVDAANYTSGDFASPGQIVTIFGSRMGPAEGVAFSLVNGRVPSTLGGTQVLVNDQPIPLLYVSASQINAVLPFDLQPNGPFDVVVRNGSATGNKLPPARIGVAGLFLFTLDGSGHGHAAAINEDGTVNSPQHPAKPGSRVMLFGTGGGQTNPPGAAGEVTPLEIRWLANMSGVSAGSSPLTVEFAGAAPGLVTGVNQINVKLPDLMPKVEGYPSGTLPLFPSSSNTSYSPKVVTISVTGN